RAADVVRCVTALAPRTSRAILLTYAPRTPALAAMHAVGRLFPRGDRAPAIEPVEGARLVRSLRDEALLSGWQGGRSQRVSSGFYTSQALEWLR
ncbi:MAG: magnesium protoporphyrin IX methyltransferase, partial [Betaproteobacteria bacterium]|nr:magnesium protoporphyrin IX methyltransferase [Betaproteobacteria bacterium]